MLRRLDDGAVAGDIRHRTQRIHLLRARDARHAVHRQDRRAGRRQLFEEFRVLPRPDEADQRLVRPQPGRFVALGRPDLHDHVGLLPQLARRPDDVAAGLSVCLVREIGAGAGVGLDGNTEAEFHQLFRDVGRCCDAPLPCVHLSGYADFHTGASLWTAAV